MRLLTTKETKNVLLSGILAFSLFISGCSSDTKVVDNLDRVSQQITNMQDTSTDDNSRR